jgi:hypothetical protein
MDSLWTKEMGEEPGNYLPHLLPQDPEHERPDEAKERLGNIGAEILRLGLWKTCDPTRLELHRHALSQDWANHILLEELKRLHAKVDRLLLLHNTFSGF